MLEPGSTDGVPTSAEGLSKVLRGLDAYDSGAGPSTLASLSIPKLSLPVDATGAYSLLSMLPDLAGRYLREPERMVTNAMLRAQVLPLSPDPFVDRDAQAPHLPRTVSITGSPRDGAIYSRAKRKSWPLCNPQRWRPEIEAHR